MKIKNILEQCKKKLLNEQKKDGHWVYELEADTTIPSEYILMNHFLGIKENDLEKKLAAYIKKEQNPDGGGLPLALLALRGVRLQGGNGAVGGGEGR